MLKELRFVKGSIATKDLVPALQHLQIKDGRVTGFNGTLSLSSPIAIPFDVVPRADLFIKAVDACEEEVDITLTKSGRLKMVSGEMTAFVDCLTEWETAMPPPDGERVELKAPLLPVVKKLNPFISKDASRPWSRGIRLCKDSIHVTNNIILIQMYTGTPFPFEVIIPDSTVKELIRIGEEPEAMGTDGNTLTFYYSDDRWLRTCIIDGGWPPVEQVFEMYGKGKTKELPDDFFKRLRELVPFLSEDRSVFFDQGIMTTDPHPETGVKFPTEIKRQLRFNADQLILLEDIVETIDLGNYPEPCFFKGAGLRGIIMGMVYAVR